MPDQVTAVAGDRTGSGGREPEPSRFLLLGNRSFRLYWIGGTLSSVGTWMHNIVAAILILRVSDSPAMVGLLSFLYFSPMFFLSFLGGVLSDRYDRRYVVIACHALPAVLTYGLAVVVLTDHLTAPVLLGVSLCLGVANAVSKPAMSALVPALVPRAEIARATALSTMQFHIGQLAGGAAAAWVLSSNQFSAAFFFNASTYLVPIVAMLSFRIAQERGAGNARASTRRSLGELFRYALHHRFVWSSLLSIYLANSVGEGMRVLAPIFAYLSAQLKDSQAALLVTSFATGSTAGLVLFGVLTRVASLRVLLITGLVLELVGAMGVAAFTLTYLGFGAAALIGLGFSMAMPNLTAVLQMRAPDHLRGRVMALYSMVLGLRPFTSLAASLLATVISPRLVMACLGAMCVVGFFATQFADEPEPVTDARKEEHDG